ncbi:LTA synthase family protein [Mesobacillus selenatarsenatis]|uniref:Lipoteichoic acid synthase LtaS type IIIa n=1 Tax=Mesobacillus selenatarsenatis (strain DSM 18680 / JCM 14380 / FERM P-15431 / SF-1) TaxID=1321606 RepID=A0A0A8X8R3_MESS1|nr:LTA synthase family protein [Mesobacillus selenatarsenatis]GAM14546.1 lipoteichoic acid synthase LtaS type IIIa [Mesobacillus selenatarsenatis SF-1]
MGTKKNMSISFVLIAIVLLWLKTYTVYKFNFDIDIENSMQEFILFINPLSFLMIVLGLGVFMAGRKQKTFVVATSFITSFILYANVVYYKEFSDFITIPLLTQTSNMGDLKSSVGELIGWTDIMYFADALLILALAFVKTPKVSFKKYKSIYAAAFYFSAIGLAFFNLGLSESERPELLTRTFDREILVKNIGTYNHHIYDAYLQTKTTAQRAMADGNQLTEIENYTRAQYAAPSEEMFGAAKGKNIIVISMESTQNFVIGQKVNGQEITPFLNEFIKDSYYFDNFYHQTAQGKTSDSEFLLENSLYPLGRGAVFFTHSGNEYMSLAERLKENAYYTAKLHANNKSFWNRDVMYNNFGYDRFYSLPDYEVNEENSVGWGMKDIEFFDQSIEHLKAMPKPFFAKFITLTNHFPFELDEEDKFIDEYDSNSGTLNRYFPTVRYTDEAFKLFIEDLKAEGLYEDSIIVIYGDHYGISENHNKAMEQYLGKEITPFVSTQLQRVPMIIHIPGHEGKTISTVSGQIDLRPTLLNLAGIDTKQDIQFGEDLFSEKQDNFVALRDGSFITEDVVYTKGVCYDKATGEPTDGASCEPYIEHAKNELSYSDQIIYGDLLRFYEKDEQQQ